MKKILLLMVLMTGIFINTGCDTDNAARESEPNYNNDAVGNKYILYEIGDSDIRFFILDYDTDIRLPSSYDKRRFSLHLDGEMTAKQETNNFELAKVKFMEKPTDVAIAVHDENDEIILTVEMPGFMIFTANESIEDIAEKCGKAESLALVGNIMEMEHVSELSGLKYLCISNNDMNELKSLSGLKNLKKFIISECPEVRDVSSIAELSGLENVVFDECYSLEDIGPVSELESLKYLILSGNIKLEDISLLAELPNLEYLNIAGCPKVRDISMFEGNGNLRVDFE